MHQALLPGGGGGGGGVCADVSEQLSALPPS